MRIPTSAVLRVFNRLTGASCKTIEEMDAVLAANPNIVADAVRRKQNGDTKVIQDAGDKT